MRRSRTLPSGPPTRTGRTLASVVARALPTVPTLRQLDAEFLKIVPAPDGEMGTHFLTEGVPVAQADGVMFLCPKCYRANSGPVGTHRVLCWFVGKVPDSLDPKPGRWTPRGTGLDDLTFVPGNPPRAVSILLTAGCGWHGFVRQGSAD